MQIMVPIAIGVIGCVPLAPLAIVIGDHWIHYNGSNEPLDGETFFTITAPLRLDGSFGIPMATLVPMATMVPMAIDNDTENGTDGDNGDNGSNSHNGINRDIGATGDN